VQLNVGFTLCFGLADQITVPSATVWGPSADSCRLEVQLHWRLCRRSWSASDWRKAYESQLSAVFLGERWWRRNGTSCKLCSFGLSCQVWHIVLWNVQALGLRQDDTFSTTMLNNTIEQLVNEMQPCTGTC